MTELGKWPITLLQVTFFCGTHRPHSEKRLSKPSAAISSEAAAKCPSPPPKKTNIPTTCDLKHKTLRPNVDAIWPHDRINQCLFSARFSRGSLRGARALRSMPDADWGRWVKTAREETDGPLLRSGAPQQNSTVMDTIMHGRLI